MEQRSFECPKCGNTEYETGQIRASGGGFSAFFNLENKRFNTLSCTSCGYTEMYKGNVSGIGKLLDLMGG